MMTGRERDRQMRQRRMDAGLCTRCAEVRGPAGTKTLCRSCANRQSKMIRQQRAANLLNPKPRSENGYVLLSCENCFRPFEWKGSGNRVFCDSCIPWFDDDGKTITAVDHEAEQAQARKARALSPQSILEHWQRQG